MRAAEFVFSAIVAFAIVYVIFQSEKIEPETLHSTDNGFTFEFTTVPITTKDTAITIPVKLTGPIDSTMRVWFRTLKLAQDTSLPLYRYGKTPLTSVNKDSGLYEALLQTGTRSRALRYYFELRDPVGRYLAGIKQGEDEPLITRVIGHVDEWIKYCYFITMFLAILFITKASAGSVALIGGKGSINEVKTEFMLGLIFSIFSAVLFKSWYGLQLNGEIWQAVPFGRDIKDSLQQILIFYLILMFVLTSKLESVISKSLTDILGVIAFFITASAYLLPFVLSSNSVPITLISYFAIGIILATMLLTARRIRSN
jgi:hypothetical protein